MASALAGPRRRRGGDRRAALGGVAMQGRLQREARSGGEAPERRVGASAKQEGAGLALHGTGGGALHSGGEKQSRGAGGRG